MDLAKQPLNYADAALAALEVDIKTVLRAVEQPVLMLADEHDPRDAGISKLARLGTSVRVAPRPESPEELASVLRGRF